MNFEFFRADLVATLDYPDGMGPRVVVRPSLLGLGLTDNVPDAKAIWALRERPSTAGVIEVLFALFDLETRKAGHIPMSGQNRGHEPDFRAEAARQE